MKKIKQMANCKPFSWADVPACDFGARCYYDNEGATKFISSQIFADNGKFRVVVKGEVAEEMGGYSMTPDQHYSDRTGTSSSADFTSEDDVVKAYYAISYAFARINLPWPPPSQFHEEFKAAGYHII